MKYKPSKKIKKIKKQGTQELKGLMVLGVILMIIMAVIIILDSKEILPHKPITVAGYHVFQDAIMMCWVFTGIGILLAVKMASFVNKLEVQRHKESLEKIQALESRIDYLEDNYYPMLRDEIDNHSRILERHTYRIREIEDYLSEKDDYPNEAKEYISGDPRAEKKRDLINTFTLGETCISSAFFPRFLSSIAVHFLTAARNFF